MPNLLERHLPIAATFAVALASAGFLTPAAMRWSVFVGLVDHPRAGEEQQMSVPRAGGHAIYIAFVIGILASLGMIGRDDREWVRLAGLAAGVAVLIPFAVWDDVRRLGPFVQLVAQFACATIPVLFGITMNSISNPLAPPPFGGQIPLPEWVAVPATIVWLVLMMNSMNWLDTMDGLAGGVGAIASVFLVVVCVGLDQWTIALLPAALAGACLGFIPFNFHPARVFMGTSGSMFLGYALGVIGVIGGAKVASTMLVLGVPVLDAILVIVQRLVGGRSPFHGGDKAHLVHQLRLAGLGTRQIALLVYALCAICGVMATALVRLEKFYAFGALALALAGLFAFVRVRTVVVPSRSN
jgi:UDP-GlcNAc:undecaprenyl-phosphate GlcNAc-1-phosphate transferase